MHEQHAEPGGGERSSGDRERDAAGLRAVHPATVAVGVALRGVAAPWDFAAIDREQTDATGHCGRADADRGGAEDAARVRPRRRVERGVNALVHASHLFDAWWSELLVADTAAVAFVLLGYLAVLGKEAAQRWRQAS